MLWVAVIVLCLVGILVVALFLPLTVHIEFENGTSRFEGSVSIRWLFGHRSHRTSGVECTADDDRRRAVVTRSGEWKQAAITQKRVFTLVELVSLIKDLPTWLRMLSQLLPVFRRFCSHLHIRVFQ